MNEFKAYDYILWTDKDAKASWLWYLMPTIDCNTRLLPGLDKIFMERTLDDLLSDL
jgi:hypothetical protein